MSVIVAATAKPVISEARRNAARINGAKSRGPKTLDGKAQSRLNAIKHGLTGAGTVLPEAMAEAVERFRDDLTRMYPPRDVEDRRLIEQASLAAARSEQVWNIEMAQQVSEADRAQTSWEIDRAAEAEALADRLDRRPSRVAAELKTRRYGCEWMIRRWKGLIQVLESQGVWDDAQRTLALNLLGVPAELRGEHPMADPETSTAALAELARKELTGLRRLRRDVLLRRDAFERQMAESGMTYTISSANWRLIRYEQSCNRRFHACIKELRRRRGGEPSAQAPAQKPQPAPEASQRTVSQRRGTPTVEIPGRADLGLPYQKTPVPAEVKAPVEPVAAASVESTVPTAPASPAEAPTRNRLTPFGSSASEGNRRSRRASAARARAMAK